MPSANANAFSWKGGGDADREMSQSCLQPASTASKRAVDVGVEEGLDEVLPPSRLDEANPYRDSSMSFRYLHPASTLDSTTDSFVAQEEDEQQV